MTFDAAPVVPVFPGQPLDLRVEIYTNGWQDITPYVFMDTTSVRRGHPDESTTASPSNFPGTFNNMDGRFSSLNPLGPYYGYLGLNTPIRVSIPEGSTYLRLENDSVSGAKCSPAMTLGSFEVIADINADNWVTNQVLAAQWASAGNLRSWIVTTNASGLIQLIISTDGTMATEVAASSTLPVPKVHGRVSVRVSYNSTAHTVTFYTGSLLTSWVQLGSVVSLSGTVFHSTAPVEVAVNSADTDFTGYTGLNGKLYAFAVLTGVGVPVTSAYCSADFTAVSAGSTGFTDAQGNTWTLEGTSEVSDRWYRFHGQVSAWPQSWKPGDPKSVDVRVNLSSDGLLRQMGGAETSTQSPMRRAYSRFSGPLQGYWSCEDGSAAQQVASGIGGPAGLWSIGSPQLSSFSDFACSAPLPVLNGATLTCPVPVYSNIATATPGTNSDAITRFLMGVPSGGDTNGAVVASVYYAPGGVVARVDLTYGTGGSLALSGYSSSNAQVWTTGPVGFAVDGKLNRVSIELRNLTGGKYTASFTVITAGVSGGGISFGAGSPGVGVTGTVTNVSKIVFNTPGGTALTGTAIGHVSVQSVWSSLFDMAGALAAFVNEPAGVRFQRICGEEGILFRGVGRMSDTALMGPQTQETPAALLQECADADRGMWFEPRQCLGYGYRTRVSIGNRPAALVLDYNLDHLSDGMAPTQDDQTLKNDITVTAQASGSSAHAVLNDGSLLAVNGKAGRYDTSLTLNVASDSQLADEAGWILHALTVNEPRYTSIGVDLANTAIASLWFQILEVDMGDRIQVLNPPPWLPPGVIDQIVQGASGPLSLKALEENWNTIPASPWDAATFDDVVYGRADTDGSTLHASVTSTATALLVDTIAGFPLWTTSGAEFPFDVRCGGERITVTNITGSSGTQTFTVVRSVNGVVKSHSAGDDVRLWTPAILSF